MYISRIFNIYKMSANTTRFASGLSRDDFIKALTVTGLTYGPMVLHHNTYTFESETRKFQFDILGDKYINVVQFGGKSAVLGFRMPVYQTMYTVIGTNVTESFTV